MRALDWSTDGSHWPTRRGSRFVDTGELRFLVWQGGMGPDLLLLHGVGGSTHCWAPLLPHLTPHFRVTAPDLPGHGFTASPSDERISLSGMSRDVGLLLETLDIHPLGVVGHSAGAGLGMMLILEDRIRPEVWVGVNPSLVPPKKMPLPPLLERLARPFVQANAFAGFWAALGSQGWALRSLLKSTGSSVSPVQEECYRRIARSPAQVHTALTMMSNWAPELLSRGFDDVVDRCGELLLLAGEDDRWIPRAEVEEVAARIRGARLETIPGGHLAPEEHPVRLAAAVRQAVVRARGC